MPYQSGFKRFKLNSIRVTAFIICLFVSSLLFAQSKKEFNVIGFYTGKNDQAHISFVHEANQWFSEMAVKNNFHFDSTNQWSNMNDSFLSRYQVVLFLDTRPEDSLQRLAFQKYMDHGGAWMGFHFSAFALNNSDVPQNWNWYHQTFLGSGNYVSNTWRPTSAVLRVENKKHPAVKKLPETFSSAPNEWYRWENDLRKNPDISILLSIDSTSFPLGTGPKLSEIWHSGYYPVAWSNKNYRMIYMNMGHNDIDYEHHNNNNLSLTFDNKTESLFILNSLLWLGRKRN